MTELFSGALFEPAIERKPCFRCLASDYREKDWRERGHVTFVDTSQQAYGAAAYIRSAYLNDQSKVASLTPILVQRPQLMLTVLKEPIERVT